VFFVIELRQELEPPGSGDAQPGLAAFVGATVVSVTVAAIVVVYVVRSRRAR
jgi:hypothetical protein